MIKLMPFLVFRFLSDLCTWEGLCGAKIFCYTFGLALYFLSPFDIIPESVFGVLGLIDDVLIFFLCLIPISRGIYTSFAERAIRNQEQNELPAQVPDQAPDHVPDHVPEQQPEHAAEHASEHGPEQV